MTTVLNEIRSIYFLFVDPLLLVLHMPYICIPSIQCMLGAGYISKSEIGLICMNTPGHVSRRDLSLILVASAGNVATTVRDS